MNRSAQVLFLPTLAQPDDFTGKVVVVIDVLRATTTVAHALASGATSISPFHDVEAARNFARQDASILLCGERNEQRIDGFHLGNSPGDYTSDVVGGRRIALTTTNGTAALHHCRAASRLILAAFVNLTAVAECLQQLNDQDIIIVCAGTRGEITMEDMLLAGALIDNGIEASVQNDQAQYAALAWDAVNWQSGELLNWLERSQGGRNLINSGFQKDIAFAALIDQFQVVPEFDPVTEQITVGAGQGSAHDRDPVAVD